MLNTIKYLDLFQYSFSSGPHVQAVFLSLSTVYGHLSSVGAPFSCLLIILPSV